MQTRHVTLLTAKAYERDGERWIEGWATTGAKDRVGDIVSPEGAEFTLPIPLLFAHKHDEPIGSVVEATVTKAGIRIRAKLTAGVARAEEVWKLILDSALSAVSIGFQSLKQTPLPNGGYRFDSWSWHELSVVSVPANPEARISVAKCAAYASEAPGLGVAKTPVSTIQRPSLPVRTDKIVTGADIDIMEYSRSLGEVIREAIKPLKDRIAALEGEVAERGIRFRGYWRDGLTVRKGDCITNDGSLWVAVRDTDEAPNSSSPDWCLAARKGRDGK